MAGRPCSRWNTLGGMHDIIHPVVRRAASRPVLRHRHSRMISAHRFALATVLALSLACASRPVVPDSGATPSMAPITTGDELIAAMHSRYAGRYLSTLSFLQN